MSTILSIVFSHPHSAEMRAAAATAASTEGYQRRRRIIINIIAPPADRDGAASLLQAPALQREVRLVQYVGMSAFSTTLLLVPPMYQGIIVVVIDFGVMRANQQSGRTSISNGIS